MFSKNKSPEITFKLEGESDLEYINAGQIKEKLQQLKHKINDSFTREIKRKIGNNLTKKNKGDKQANIDSDRKLVKAFETAKDNMLQKIHDAEETGYLVNLQEYLRLYYKIKASKNITEDKVKEFLDNIDSLEANLNKQKYDIPVFPEAWHNNNKQQLDEYYYDERKGLIGGYLFDPTIGKYDNEYKFEGMDHRNIRFIGPYQYFFINKEKAIRLRNRYDSKEKLPPIGSTETGLPPSTASPPSSLDVATGLEQPPDAIDQFSDSGSSSSEPPESSPPQREKTRFEKLLHPNMPASALRTTSEAKASSPPPSPKRRGLARFMPGRKGATSPPPPETASAVSQEPAQSERPVDKLFKMGGRTRRKYRNKKRNKKAYKSAKK